MIDLWGALGRMAHDANLRIAVNNAVTNAGGVSNSRTHPSREVVQAVMHVFSARQETLYITPYAAGEIARLSAGPKYAQQMTQVAALQVGLAGYPGMNEAVYQALGLMLVDDGMRGAIAGGASFPAIITKSLTAPQSANLQGLAADPSFKKIVEEIFGGAWGETACLSRATLYDTYVHPDA